MAAMAVWIAAVPEATAKACLTPISSANSFSSCFTAVPFVLVSVPLCKTFARISNSESLKVRPEISWSEGSCIGPPVLKVRLGID